MLEKNETKCEHIVKTLERTVCVTDGCRSENAHTINGKRAVTLKECERCKHEMKLADELENTKARAEELQERLATAIKALNEAEEKADSPSGFQVDIRTGIIRWLNAYGSDAKGVGKTVLANLLAQLDGTPEEALNEMFKENGENE